MSKHIAKLLRFDATIGQDLPQEPEAQRACAKWNDGCPTVLMPQEIVTPL